MKKLQIVGHRGARGLAPENTIAAMHKALEQRVDEIEIDVRVTKDNRVVVHHDRRVRDQAGNSLDIRQHTYEELLTHKPDLATLTDVIAAINKAVPLQIEVKPGEQSEPIAKVLRHFLQHGWRPTDFLIGSKQQRVLIQLHRALPAVPTVIIEPFSSLHAIWRARQLRTTRISMRSTWLWSGFVRFMHHRDYQLYAYTVNTPPKAHAWHQSGLTGVITDNPEAFRNA